MPDERITERITVGRIDAPRAGLHGAGPLYTLDGIAPRIAATAFIAPTAVVIGRVEVGEESSVWFGCVLRGDMSTIRIGARTNVQDGTIVHVNAGDEGTVIGDDVTIGHNAIIHACRLADRAFVGMGAMVLDGAAIEQGGVLGAGGLLSPGKVIGANELWVGAPAKLKRVLSEDERAGFDRNARVYVGNGARYRAGLRGG